MEANLLNSDFETIATLDVFDSFIWTDRYNECGDFEIAASPTLSFFETISDALYMTLKESEHAMTIEDIAIHNEPGAHSQALVTGRSIETFLNRRVVWAPSALSGNFQDAIETLLNNNVINPTDPSRKISRLEFVRSTDPNVTGIEVNTQFVGDYIDIVIRDLCVAAGLGWKLTLSDLGKLQFKLYAGVDRSYDQLINPHVTFSVNEENLINADYKASVRSVRTTALVLGERGVENGRRAIQVDAPGGSGSDLDRREMCVDAAGVSRSIPDGGTLNDDEYDLLLQQKGLEELEKNTFVETFEGQLDTSKQYTYNEDFYMGDIVQVADEFGHEGRSRVVEMIHSQNPSGVKKYPTFTKV